MYPSARINTHLFTPESTPVKRGYNRLLPLSVAPPTSSDVESATQRRLPRKPVRSPPNFPEPLQPEVKYRSKHPVDFIVSAIIQSFYQHVYLVAREELRSPVLSIRRVATSLTIFSMHLTAILSACMGLGFWAAKIAVKFTAEKLAVTMHNVSERSTEFVRNFWTEVAQLRSNALRDYVEHLSSNIAPMASPTVDSTPRRAGTPASISSPCGRGRACPPSPCSLRKPRRATPRSSPCPSMMTPLRTDATRVSTTPATRSLGHRAEDLYRILADCSELQLEEAERLVCGLQARAKARAGWKL